MKYDPLKHHRRSIRLAGYDYAAPGAYFVTICTRQRQMYFDQLELRQLAEACWRAIPAHAPQVELDEWVIMPNHIHGLIVIVERGEANDDENVDQNADAHGRGVQLNAPTTNTLDNPRSNTMNTPSSNALENVDNHGRGVQLNAPTTNTLDNPRSNTMNTPSSNALENADDHGRGVQLNAPTTNTLNAPTTNPLARPRDADNPFSVMSPRRHTLSVIVRTYKAAVTTACRAAQRPEFAWQRGFYEHVVRDQRQLDALRRYERDNPLKWALDRDNPANTRRLSPPVSVAEYLDDLALTPTP